MSDLKVEAPTVDRGPTTGDPTVARSVLTTAVVTPEAVLLEFRAAGIGSRLLAKVADTILQILLFTVVAIALGISAPVIGETGLIVAFVIATFLILFGYPASEAAFGGATPGKKMFGIRVITLEGGPVRFRHAAIRSILWLPEAFIPPGGVVALTCALLTRRSQRIGDLAAGTVVVRVSKAEASPTFFAPARGAEQFSQQFDASRLSPVQYSLVREFLLRAHHLTAQARGSLARELAEGVERATGVDRPPWVGDEQYLVACTFAYQHRFGPTAQLAVPMAGGPVVASPSPGRPSAWFLRR